MPSPSNSASTSWAPMAAIGAQEMVAEFQGEVIDSIECGNTADPAERGQDKACS